MSGNIQDRFQSNETLIQNYTRQFSMFRAKFRGVFKTLSNICDEAFCENS